MINQINIVITSYNQYKYLFNCLDSVLKQKKIQYKLIIIDDASNDFNKKNIEEYIKKYKSNNLLDYQILTNTINLGTVKSLNKTLDFLEYEFSIFIAADDELCNEDCLYKVINKFSFLDKSIKLLITQTKMFDENLKDYYYDFMDKKFADKFNNLSSKAIFNVLSKGCFIPAGSTIYRTEFIKNKKFDEKYELIEDWPMYLYCSRNNIKMHWENIHTINHRAGGISHTAETTEKHTIFNKDLYKIHNYELIPYLNIIYIRNKFWVVRTFKFYKKNYFVKTENNSFNINYCIINLLLIVYYNSIKIKNFVKTSTYTTLSILILMSNLLYKNCITDMLSKLYYVITIILLLYNIIYEIIIFINKRLNKNRIDRR